VSRHPQEKAKKAVALLQEKFGGEILSVEESAGQVFVNVKREKIVEILTALRDEPGLKYDCLMDLAGADYLGRDFPERFCVAYNLFSFETNEYFRVKAFVPGDDPEIDSVGGVYRSAPWAEREAYDFFGIRFRGHPDLKRILLPDHYVGYPLRKDYPLRGMGERDAFPRYDEAEDE
jgi:NADH-quinone oxidoreductase subunit C